LSILPSHNLRIACANTPYIVGKWKEIGKTATLEFWKDGTFKAIDNQKMAVKGKYTMIEPGNVRFEIFRHCVYGKLSAETVEKGSVREHIFLELCYTMIF